MQLRPLPALALFCLAWGCSSPSSSTPDAAGPVTVDAGTDAGPSTMDAGQDAGPEQMDAGSPTPSNVSLGYEHDCAVRADHTLWCWGTNDHGELGDGTTTTRNVPTQVGTSSDWATVSARGWETTCAVKLDGTLWCWGMDLVACDNTKHTGDVLTPTQVGTATSWASVMLSYWNCTACALGQDNSLSCWGNNVGGQVGDGTTDNQSAPEKITAGQTWLSVDLAGDTTCGVRADHTLWCWGGNWSGDVGNGTTDQQNSPVQVGTDSDWQLVGGGGLQICAVKQGGTLWCWGENGHGELGIGSTDQHLKPVQAGTDTDWAGVAGSESGTCGLKKDGAALCWGDNTNGQLGTGSTTSTTVPTAVEGGHQWSSLSPGSVATCGLAQGQLYCWGSDIGTGIKGVRGDGTVHATSLPPTPLNGSDWTFVTAGELSACGLRADGVRWCWGDNGSAELGNGTETSQFLPAPIDSTTHWKLLSMSASASCGIQTDGSLWCWGGDGFNQLGDGMTNTQPSPIQVTVGSGHWLAVSTNWESTAAIDSTGALWGWGGTMFDVMPKQFGTDTNWTQVALGNHHWCALKGAGELWCGYFGNLNQIGTDSDWVSVSTGENHDCALKQSGDLYCWGDNSAGELGTGDMTNQDAPMLVPGGKHWKTVTAEEKSTCGVDTDGALWCWGANDGAQLGFASPVMVLVPTQVGTDTSWASVSLGATFGVGRHTDGTVSVWGPPAGILQSGQPLDQVTTPKAIAQ